MKRALLVVIVAVACRHDMYERPARRPLGRSDFFVDGNASRPQIADTVARPVEDSRPRPSLERGRQRFEIFCAPCHGTRGDGNGVIVQHGFPAPPAFSPAMTDAEIVDVITRGRNTMYSYADRVSEADRWAIAAYVRQLER